MDEFNFEDWGNWFDGGPDFSTPNIDYSNLIDAFGGIDLSNVDLTGGNLSNIDLSNIDLGGFNLSDYASLADAFGGSTDTSGITQLLGSSDLSNVVSSATDAAAGTTSDTTTADLGGGFTSTDYAALEDAFGGGATQQDSTLTTEEALKDQFWKDTTGATDATAGTGKIETVTYNDGSKQTILTKPDGTETVMDTTTSDGITYNSDGVITDGPRAGEMIKSSDIKGKATVLGGGTDGTKDVIKKILDKFMSSKGSAASLAALLGGLYGAKTGYRVQPRGYTGGIPKYIATRGTPVSPTAGGRRPGGAGIGSLTGGVTYTRAAHGGLMGLKKGQYLDGATDGMADKLHTDIDGVQPARLSHGEFVIPADVVSHLGNGNSDAGANVLYEMMAKVRKARTGTARQGKQINPHKYTPA